MKTKNSLFIEGLSREELLSDLREQVRAIIREELDLRTKAPPKFDIELLTIEETANVFKVSPRTIFNWGQNNLLTAISIGRRVYFRKEAVKELIEKNESKR